MAIHALGAKSDGDAGTTRPRTTADNLFLGVASSVISHQLQHGLPDAPVLRTKKFQRATFLRVLTVYAAWTVSPLFTQCALSGKTRGASGRKLAKIDNTYAKK